MNNFYLTKSKIRSRLLAALFEKPAGRYYLAELARIAGTSSGNIQRELKSLVADELVNVEKKEKINFYTVNRRHPLFHEIKSLIAKTAGIQPQIKKLVSDDPSIVLAMIYGSVARSEEKGSSDIDLLVVSNGAIRSFYSGISKIEKFCGREVNPTVYSPEEFKAKLKSGNGFVRNVLKQPHTILKGDPDAFR